MQDQKALNGKYFLKNSLFTLFISYFKIIKNLLDSKKVDGLYNKIF